MRAFITGASGFIGTHLVDKLLERSWRVRALQHSAPVARDKDCEIVRGDILDPSSYTRSLADVDVLFHLASALGASLIDRKDFFRINALGSSLVIDAARRAGIKRVVHFSSAGVLGAVRDGETADETYPLSPKTAYDESKLAGERKALALADEGIEVVVIRPGWVYGPGDRRTFKLIRAIAKSRFMLVTKGKICQTPVYIDDLLEGSLLCAERGQSGEIYHLAGGEVLPVKNIVQTIAGVAGKKIPRLTLPLFPVKLAARVLGKAFSVIGKEAPLTEGKLAFFIHPKPLDIRKAKTILGYVPETDFRAGMAKTLNWYRDHGWL